MENVLLCQWWVLEVTVPVPPSDGQGHPRPISDRGAFAVETRKSLALLGWELSPPQAFSPIGRDHENLDLEL